MKKEIAKSDPPPLGSISAFVAVIATLIGLSFPGVGAAMGVSGSLLQFGQEALNKRQDRKFKKLELTIRNVCDRVGQLEASKPTEEIIDLFLELSRSLVEDDEDLKAIVYEGALTWVMTEKPGHAQVRAVRCALRDLSFVEILFFARECAGQSGRELVERELGENLVWERLSQAGMCSRGTNYHGNPTIVGKGLVEYCPLATLENAWKEKRAAGTQ